MALPFCTCFSIILLKKQQVKKEVNIFNVRKKKISKFFIWLFFHLTFMSFFKFWFARDSMCTSLSYPRSLSPIQIFEFFFFHHFLPFFMISPKHLSFNVSLTISVRVSDSTNNTTTSNFTIKYSTLLVESLN